jgi:hypothetical protein
MDRPWVVLDSDPDLVLEELISWTKYIQLRVWEESLRILALMKQLLSLAMDLELLPPKMRNLSCIECIRNQESNWTSLMEILDTRRPRMSSVSMKISIPNRSKVTRPWPPKLVSHPSTSDPRPITTSTLILFVPSSREPLSTQMKMPDLIQIAEVATLWAYSERELYKSLKKIERAAELI